MSSESNNGRHHHSHKTPSRTNSDNIEKKDDAGERSTKSSLKGPKKGKTPEDARTTGSATRNSGGSKKDVRWSQTIQERRDVITETLPQPVSVFSRNFGKNTQREPKATRETILREFFEFDWHKRNDYAKQEARKRRLDEGFESYATLLYETKRVEKDRKRVTIFVPKKQCLFKKTCKGMAHVNLPILDGRPNNDLERLDLFFILLKGLDLHFQAYHNKDLSEYEHESIYKIFGKLYDVIVERIDLRGYKTPEDAAEQERLQKIEARTQEYKDIIASSSGRT